MTSPEALELEAVDAALAGRYVAPEHAELAELALLLRDDRPEPEAAWTARLDRRVAAGFPAAPRKPRFSFMHNQIAPVFAVLLLLAVPIGLAVALGGGSGDDSGSSASGTVEAVGGDSSAGAAGAGAEQAAPSARTAPPPAAADSARPRKVQRSAEITIAAPRRQIDSVATQIGDVTASLGGYVARSSVTSSSGGSLQLRVPSDKLDTAIQRLSKLGKVRQLSRNSEDITAQVHSARDRLNEARAERKGLLKQLAEATTINETDSIKARLRIVSREIAADRAALKRVNNRADFADVAVTLMATRGKSGAAAGGWTPGDAFHDALRVLEVLAGVLVIAAAVLLPLLIAALLGWLARRGVTRRRRERALDMA
jgi:hypothetical protein